MKRLVSIIAIVACLVSVAIVVADVTIDLGRFYTRATTELEAKNYRIEVIAYDTVTETPYEVFIDTFNYASEGTTITLHTILHGEVR